MRKINNFMDCTRDYKKLNIKVTQSPHSIYLKQTSRGLIDATARVRLKANSFSLENVDL